MSFINGLKPASSLRSLYSYTNWNFAALGEIFERLAGMSYGSFIDERTIVPLNMSRTLASHAKVDDDNLAVPHAILDDISAYELPLPKSEDSTIMAAAQGIYSTGNDLLKYPQALTEAYHSQLQSTDAYPRSSPLRDVVKQSSAHTSRGSPSLLQKAYCLGMHRHQLPNQLDRLGCNTMFVEKIPLLAPGGDVRLLLSHGGSLAGYTAFSHYCRRLTAPLSFLSIP
ncbi:Beta-lactamase/transpeptidase-like protein [Beauveria brongniartii RCEF 3172]|uniref:Beta-lactamase/transpeptidase-like protein n=1 Tax=Beauveria brongniartii RCEF 3172 TaxID=1081107 RepID=A0A167BWJ3_9HYPO|nr:Beta-lactamase/transpeptidase-like protein [Beauveria brongniartii RCEF 3172]